MDDVDIDKNDETTDDVNGDGNHPLTDKNICDMPKLDMTVKF